MRSTLKLTIELSPTRNLHTDGPGIATELETILTDRLARYDNLGSAHVILHEARIYGQVELIVQSVNN